MYECDRRDGRKDSYLTVRASNKLFLDLGSLTRRLPNLIRLAVLVEMNHLQALLKEYAHIEYFLSSMCFGYFFLFPN